MRALSLLTCLLLLLTACDDGAGSGTSTTDTGSIDTGATDSGTDVPTGVTCGSTVCATGEVCESGQCAAACTGGVDACEGICCATGETCEGGTCTTCTGELCGGACCGTGEGCDSGSLSCEALCGDGRASCNGQCCNANRACEDGQCRADCGTGETRCGDRVEFELCCGLDEVCEGGECLPDCGGNARCGSALSPFCCGAGEVCEANTCKVDCGGTRCGANDELCCTSDQRCLFDSCITPQGTCTDSFDCPLDAFCEVSIGECVLVEDDPNQCIFVPPVGDFQPTEQWVWNNSGNTGTGAFNQVMMMPIVINLTDDNRNGAIDSEDIPDVVFGTYQNSYYNRPGQIHVLSGDTGRELAVTPDDFSVSSDLGAADIDGDGRPEIIVSSARHQTGSNTNLNPRHLYALELVPDSTGRNYTLEITGDITLSSAFNGASGRTTAAFADLEGDGSVEVISQFGITDGASFTMRCEAPVDWSHAAVADLDGDGTQEIIAAGGIYDKDCGLIIGGSSGRPAIADLLPDTEAGDLKPEIAWVRGGHHNNGYLEIWNVSRDLSNGGWLYERSMQSIIPVNVARVQSERNVDCNSLTLAFCTSSGLTNTERAACKNCNTGGGPPTIADFDGDGQPEIGLAARWYYLVYETDGTILWADSGTKDFSSAVTGSSVFDFEGDGAAEVVYNDEDTLRVYSGSGTGSDDNGDGFNDPIVLFSAPNPSGTLFEYPLIVDVDNDGNAEIVVAANNYSHSYTGPTGIRVFKDPLDNWVRTRRVWNQHTYHVTHINEDGTVPSPEAANWRKTGLNNYRQNVQPGGLFNAPNLVAGAIGQDNSSCPTILNIEAEVTNQGSLGVAAGTWVGIYAVGLTGTSTSETRALLGRAQVNAPIPPGGTGTATLAWDYSATLLPSGTGATLALPVEVEVIVDDPPSSEAPGPNGAHNECVETDNTSVSANLDECPIN